MTEGKVGVEWELWPHCPGILSSLRFDETEVSGLERGSYSTWGSPRLLVHARVGADNGDLLRFLKFGTFTVGCQVQEDSGRLHPTCPAPGMEGLVLKRRFRNVRQRQNEAAYSIPELCRVLISTLRCTTHRPRPRQRCEELLGRPGQSKEMCGIVWVRPLNGVRRHEVTNSLHLAPVCHRLGRSPANQLCMRCSPGLSLRDATQLEPSPCLSKPEAISACRSPRPVQEVG